jgi:hypothetical protein
LSKQERLDPIDIDSLISDDTMTTFHRGVWGDKVPLKRRAAVLRTTTSH